MLQRAASNAYSWWWASHIRTKQSKWLEQNLQDMEEKVGYVLKIINEDGDSFAMRAEMYYRKRPELIEFVEESFRAYRALAERYDHLSREFQNANRTIAAVFPEQVQLEMEDEEENYPGKSVPFQDPDKPQGHFPDVPNPSIPKTPTKVFKPPTMSLSKRRQFGRTGSSAKTVVSSGLRKTEALDEIDKLQKGILALQTEKEFVKSSYEHGVAKYWEMENQINEMQATVCNLQDEFGVGTVIEDDEARKLMTATAIKSCLETLVHLQEKQEKSAEVAKDEYQRIKEADEKLKTLKDEFLPNQSDRQELSGNTKQADQLDPFVEDTKQERMDFESLRDKIKEFQRMSSKKSFTVTELAEKIDELVEKIITLETAVSSQTALVSTLRSETDDLHTHIESLEKDKEKLMEDSDTMMNRLNALEEELNRVKNLNRSVEDQNINLQLNFTEANCNLDHLSEKLQNVKLDEEGENTGLIQEAENGSDAKLDEGIEEHDETMAPATMSGISKDIPEEENKDDSQEPGISVENEEKLSQSYPSANIDGLSEDTCQEPKQETRREKHEVAEAADSDLEGVEHELGMEGEDQPNWRELFIHGLEDREKFLLEEYASVLRTLKEVKKKFSDGEKKNQEGLFEQAMQIRDMRNSNMRKDEEIQSLRQKLSTLQINTGDNQENSLTEHTQSELGKEDIFQISETQSLNSDQKTVYDMLYGHNTETAENPRDAITQGSMSTSTQAKKIILVNEPRAVSAAEEKLRTDLDEMLEENLEFWLKFSTSFHQIQKFQSSIQDLQVELSKLKQKKREEGNTKHHKHSLQSEARPIYKHLREIQTELKLWLEQNSQLKDEVQNRYSSLCNIQDEISRMSNAGSGTEETELSNYQAAKFQGEVTNMKQESNKVAGELQLGLNKVKRLHVEIDRTLSRIEEEFEISGSRHSHMKNSNKPRIPLQSFLFGVKLKKQKPSIFSCMNPALQKQYSDLTSRIPS